MSGWEGALCLSLLATRVVAMTLEADESYGNEGQAQGPCMRSTLPLSLQNTGAFVTSFNR